MITFSGLYLLQPSQLPECYDTQKVNKSFKVMKTFYNNYVHITYF